MSDLHLPTSGSQDASEDQPEVRLELTRAGVQQVLSLYSKEQESAGSAFEFSFSLEDLQEAIRERRKMILIGLATGITLALLILGLSTPLYPVTAQVVLERHDVSSTATIGTPGRNSGSAFIATQAEVLHSHSVISDAVGKIPLAAHLDEADDAVADAVESVQASPVSGTQIVVLGYLGPDADHGVRLLNAIVESYRGELSHQEQESQSHKLRAKQTEIKVLASEAKAVETRIEQLRVRNQMLGSAEDAAAAQSRILNDYASRLTEIRNQRIALENRLSAGGEQLAILDPATRSMQERLWQAETTLSRVQLTLRPRHPAVETAQQEVDVLRRQLRRNSSATPDALKRDIEAALGLQTQLEDVYERERVRMAEIERYRREEEVLLSELTQIRNMSQARRGELLDQRLASRLAESGEVGVTARMIEAPAKPASAAWPKPKLVLSAGFIFGLLGGLAVALISLRRERREWIAASHPSGEATGAS